MIVAELQFSIAALSDFECVRQGFGEVGEEGRHLLFRFQVEGVPLHAHAFRFGHRLSGLDAEEDVVNRGLVASGVVDVIGGHQGQVELVGQCNQVTVDLGELRDVVILDLQIVPSFEDIAVPAGSIACVVVKPLLEMMG